MDVRQTDRRYYLVIPSHLGLEQVYATRKISPTTYPTQQTVQDTTVSQTISSPDIPNKITQTSSHKKMAISPDAPPSSTMDTEPPLHSSVIPKTAHALRLSSQQQNQWARSTLPSRVQVHLDNPFGKDTVSQSFTTYVCFCHMLVFSSNQTT